MTHLRKGQHEELPSNDPPPPPHMEAIGNLRLLRQDLVQLKFEEGLSYQEIAARQGVSIENVRFILHQTLKNLSLQLRSHGEAT